MSEGTRLQPARPPAPAGGEHSGAGRREPGLAYTSHTFQLHTPLVDLSYTWGRLEVEGPPPDAPSRPFGRAAAAGPAGRREARRRQDLAGLLLLQDPGPRGEPWGPLTGASAGAGRRAAGLRAYGLGPLSKA
jgi:hypothetical protein